jgi:hypothetical protein
MAKPEACTSASYTFLKLYNDDNGKRCLLVVIDDQDREFRLDAGGETARKLIGQILLAVGQAWSKSEFKFLGVPGEDGKAGTIVGVPGDSSE